MHGVFDDLANDALDGRTRLVPRAALHACRCRPRRVSALAEGPIDQRAQRVGELERRRRRVGDVVVVERPVPGSGWEELPPFDGRLAGRHWNLKRVAAVGVPPGTLFVLGDNPHSEDSKQWGPFPGERLLGVVVARLPRRAVG